MSLLSFTALTGCRRARIERLKNLKEAKEAAEEAISQAEEAEDKGETSSKGTGADEETEESTSVEQQQGQEEKSTESGTSEGETGEMEQETEQEETAGSSEETTEETSVETVQLTKDFINLQMEGGTIIRDGVTTSGIGCGDYADNKEVRGFASFDISEIAGTKILDAKISVLNGEKEGEPFNHYGPIIVKAVYWGPQEISPSNFDIDGVELASFTVKKFVIANKILKNDLQNAVNNGLERYQICLYYEMENTDGNGKQDLIYHYPSEIKLTVTYSTAAQ